MVTCLSNLVCLSAFILAFFWPVWAWAPITVADAILVYVLFGAKKVKWDYLPELSPTANQMLQQYGHFYAMPFAGSEYSSASSVMQLAGVVVGVVGAFKAFWWGIAIAALNYLVMGGIAVAYNPTHFLRDPTQKAAHDEIIAFLSCNLHERARTYKEL